MGEWFKDKYREILFSSFISFLFMLLLLFATGILNSKEKRDLVIEGKAEKVYVDLQDQKLENQIDKKADKSLVESMDSKLDLILDKLN